MEFLTKLIFSLLCIFMASCSMTNRSSRVKIIEEPVSNRTDINDSGMPAKLTHYIQGDCYEQATDDVSKNIFNNKDFTTRLTQLFSAAYSSVQNLEKQTNDGKPYYFYRLVNKGPINCQVFYDFTEIQEGWFFEIESVAARGYGSISADRYYPVKGYLQADIELDDTNIGQLYRNFPSAIDGEQHMELENIASLMCGAKNANLKIALSGNIQKLTDAVTDELQVTFDSLDILLKWKKCQ